MMDSEKKVRNEISNAMREVGVRLDSNLMQKCASICSSLHIEASQLAESWEVYSLNKNIHTLDEHSFVTFRQSLMKDLEHNVKTDPHDDYNSNNMEKSSILSVSGMTKRSREDVPMTPNKKSASASTQIMEEGKDDKPQRRVSMSPGSGGGFSGASGLDIAVTPVKDLTYEQRKGAGTHAFTFNPSNRSVIVPSDEISSLEPCTNIRLYGNHNVETPYRYMFTTLEQRAKALDDHLLKLQNEFFDNEGMDNYEAIGVPKQETVSVIGRVCNEAHNGRLNATSVLLEAPRHQNGTRVNLRLDAMSDSYSLFPGQIVKVEGINSSGRAMVAQSIKEGSPLPFPKTSAKELLKFQHLGTTSAQGRPLQIMTACGPFTTHSNLDYEPLRDFIMGSVKTNKPDICILTGPFVDLRQPILQKGKIRLPLDEDSFMNVSHETLFMAKISSLLENLFEEEPDLITQFILVPSLDDSVAEPVYPQPPLSDRLKTPTQPKLPSAEGIDIGSLFLQQIESIKSSFTNHHKRIHCVSNPSTIQINEIVIGITSTDSLLHISSDETNSKLMGNRMSRIAQHLIEQQSFYPLFPPPMSNPNNNNHNHNMGSHLDLGQMEQWSFPCTPDILIVPSKLATFCRNVLNCIVMNPGQLTKGNSGGTYGVMSIHPMERDTLEAVDGDAEMEHKVYERIRVDITKI